MPEARPNMQKRNAERDADRRKADAATAGLQQILRESNNPDTRALARRALQNAAAAQDDLLDNSELTLDEVREMDSEEALENLPAIKRLVHGGSAPSLSEPQTIADVKALTAEQIADHGWAARCQQIVAEAGR